MAVKVIDTNEFIYVGQVNSKGLMDGIGYIVFKPQLKKSYVAEFENGEQKGFLYANKKRTVLSVSTEATNYIDSGPAFISYSNGIEFINFQAGKKIDSSYTFYKTKKKNSVVKEFYDDGVFQRKVNLKNIHHEFDPQSATQSIPEIDFRNYKIEEQKDDSFLKLSNGIVIEEEENTVSLSLPIHDDLKLSFRTNEHGYLRCILNDSEASYFPSLIISKKEENKERVITYEHFNSKRDVFFQLDYENSEIEYIELDSERKYIDSISFNKIINNKDGFSMLGDAPIFHLDYAFLKLRKRFSQKYFGHFFIRKAGIGITEHSERNGKYDVGMYVDGKLEGPSLQKNGRIVEISANTQKGVLNGPSIVFAYDYVEFLVYEKGKVEGESFVFFFDGRIGVEKANEDGKRELTIFENITHDLDFDLIFPDSISLKERPKRYHYDYENNKRDYVFATAIFHEEVDEDEARHPSGVCFENVYDYQTVGLFAKGEPYFGLTYRTSNSTHYFHLQRKFEEDMESPYISVRSDEFAQADYEPVIKLHVLSKNGKYRYSFELYQQGYFFFDQIDLKENVITYSQTLKYLESKEKKIVIGNQDLSKYSDIPRHSKETKAKTSIAALDELVGLENIKRQVKRLKASLIKNQGRALNLHMLFMGNPGTGKTIVARIIANILHEIGILPTNNLTEVSRRDLVGGYIGETEEKTNKVIDQALGGVLFIDEAYSLNVEESPKDFGKIAIAELIARMENDRDKFVVILAGYEYETRQMIHSNPGFSSRIQMFFKFPDYSENELIDIAKIFLKKAGYTIDEAALALMIEVIEKLKPMRNYANAREVRKFIDGIILIQNERSVANVKDFNINVDDVKIYIEENGYITLLDKPEENYVIPSPEKLSELYKENVKHNYYENFAELKNRIISISHDGGESTGFIIDKTGYAVTCAHSVDDKKVVNVNLTLTIGTKKLDFSTKALVVKVDQENDIALIKIKPVINEFDYFTLSEKPLKVTEEIILPGYAWGRSRIKDITIFDGKVTNLDGNKVYIDVMGKSGQSGSPVINKKTNEVIGVYLGSNLEDADILIEEMNWATNVKKVWDLLRKEKKTP